MYPKIVEKIDLLDALVRDLNLVDINRLSEEGITVEVIRFKNVSADFFELEKFNEDAERHLNSKNLKRFIELNTQISRGAIRVKKVRNALEVVIPSLSL